jgi:hypothetical protein
MQSCETIFGDAALEVYFCETLRSENNYLTVPLAFFSQVFIKHLAKFISKLCLKPQKRPDFLSGRIVNTQPKESVGLSSLAKCFEKERSKVRAVPFLKTEE